ncbi:hypothetical protein [Variovorax sp. W2I14]|uniref:hypothetical protein n=1 Tax=Variovorax sp. W2I14 TaxID=3042290 RepID=UPI003D1CB337
MKSKWILLGLSILLTACAAPSGKPKPQTWVSDSKNGELLIYRPKSFVFGARNVYFYVDGVAVASIGSGTYSLVKLPPGPYRLSQKWDWDMLIKDMEIEINVPSKERTYVRLVQSAGEFSGGVLRTTWQLESVPSDKGLDEIKGLETRAPSNTAQ